jgi:hypothetical protein
MESGSAGETGCGHDRDLVTCSDPPGGGRRLTNRRFTGAISRHPTGRVLATTHHRDANLTGSGRTLVDVDVHTADEADTYLVERLPHAGLPHLLDDQTRNLAEALGYLPLALSHAAAYMIDQRIGCGTYLEAYSAGEKHLDALMPGDPDGHSRQPDGRQRRITVTLLLALDAANACDPVGLARPARRLAAVLDPAGHPENLWSNDAVSGYLTRVDQRPLARISSRRRPGKANRVTADQAHAAVLLLHRYGLAAIDEHEGPAPSAYTSPPERPATPPPPPPPPRRCSATYGSPQTPSSRPGQTQTRPIPNWSSRCVGRFRGADGSIRVVSGRRER